MTIKIVCIGGLSNGEVFGYSDAYKPLEEILLPYPRLTDLSMLDFDYQSRQIPLLVKHEWYKLERLTSQSGEVHLFYRHEKLTLDEAMTLLLYRYRKEAR